MWHVVEVDMDNGEENTVMCDMLRLDIREFIWDFVIYLKMWGKLMLNKTSCGLKESHV